MSLHRDSHVAQRQMGAKDRKQLVGDILVSKDSGNSFTALLNK
ncbi:hypothetical protein RCH46_28745 [Serratia fonticola]|nr:hypothetical protein [Serratia fonticola]MDQ7212793.1 hypothetical protein [Serratia fonticola]